MCPNKPRTWNQYKCIVCGKTFYRQKNAAIDNDPRKNKYCSKACVNTAFKTKHYHEEDDYNDYFTEIIKEFEPQITKMKYQSMRRWLWCYSYREIESIILREVFLSLPALKKLNTNAERATYLKKKIPNAFFEEIYPKLSREFTICDIDLYGGVYYDIDCTFERGVVALDILRKIYDYSHARRYSVFIDYMFGGLDWDELVEKYKLPRQQAQNIVYYYQKKIKAEFDG